MPFVTRSTMPPPCAFCRQGSAQAHLGTCPTQSPFLGTRLIARLSPLRRSNLQRRLTERVADAYHAVGLHDGSALADVRVRRATAMLGRLSALTA